jgi:hypothetical protein
MEVAVVYQHPFEEEEFSFLYHLSVCSGRRALRRTELIAKIARIRNLKWPAGGAALLIEYTIRKDLEFHPAKVL